jgi:DNA-binding MarR family transcriptional regulator
LSSQVLSAQLTREPKVQGWISFLRAHAAVTRELSARLEAEHGLTLSDFDVLAQLYHAPQNSLRRVDLARQVLLTASGITRLLDGLERAGCVEKASCASDARVSYAKLTDVGRRKLAEAGETHLAGIEELFTGRFAASELDSLAELLARLPLSGSPGERCSPE